MGLIQFLIATLFSDQRNLLRDTVEVFQENRENRADRTQDTRMATLAQFAKEFRQDQRSRFDQLIDGVNRLPRPFLALGTLGLLVSAMVDPIWFAARMQGIALVPDPLWWLLGIIVTFYFGARHQAKGQDFQKELAQTLAATPQVVDNLKALSQLKSTAAENALDGNGPAAPEVSQMVFPNPALDHWRMSRIAQ